jgi:membrane associated rhomboid family serine protease
MILPIGDAPNTHGPSPVTYLLLALNVAVYLFVSVPLEGRRPDPRDPRLAEYVQVMSHEIAERISPRELARRTSAYDLFVFEHGYRPAAPRASDLFVSMFLHGGFMHLAGNMLFLWIYGDNVERRLGSFRFLFWYLLTGAAATLFHGLFDLSSQVPLVGASGAISGVLGFYFIWFPRNQVRLLFLLPPFLMNVFEVSARFVLGVYLLADNLLPFLFASGDGVAHGAHIGGFLAGMAGAVWFDRRALALPAESGRAAGGPSVGDPARLASLAEAAELAERLAAEGQPRAALSVLRRGIAAFPRDPGLASAHLQAGLLLLHHLHEPTAAYPYLLKVLDLGPSPAEAQAAVKGLREIESLQKRRIGHLRASHDWRS